MLLLQTPRKAPERTTFKNAQAKEFISIFLRRASRLFRFNDHVGAGEAEGDAGLSEMSCFCVKPASVPHVHELQTRRINIHQVCYYWRAH